MSDSPDTTLPACSGARAEEFSGSVNLRIGAIFILLSSSLFTTLFPIITRRIPRCAVPTPIFNFAKYFGSGVIIATAFMHLLAPGVEELASDCLNDSFKNYDFAFAFAMISMFMVFIVELSAFRLGSGLAKSLAYDPHLGGHHHATEHSTAPLPAATQDSSSEEDVEGKGSDKAAITAAVQSPPAAAHVHHRGDLESADESVAAAAASQILGVLILEFGVIFHSVIIGITLGTTNEFTTLFIVIILHQMFEGLGLGARLAFLPLHPKSWLPYIGAVAYAAVTPIGLAIGLGVRHTYNEDSATANYVTGVFDSTSAGILLYTGLVELLAHEFIFNDKMRKASTSFVVLSVAEMLLGAGLMALLARWA